MLFARSGCAGPQKAAWMHAFVAHIVLGGAAHERHDAGGRYAAWRVRTFRGVEGAQRRRYLATPRQMSQVARQYSIRTNSSLKLFGITNYGFIAMRRRPRPHALRRGHRRRPNHQGTLQLWSRRCPWSCFWGKNDVSRIYTFITCSAGLPRTSCRAFPSNEKRISLGMVVGKDSRSIVDLW